MRILRKLLEVCLGLIERSICGAERSIPKQARRADRRRKARGKSRIQGVVLRFVECRDEGPDISQYQDTDAGETGCPQEKVNVESLLIEIWCIRVKPLRPVNIQRLRRFVRPNETVWRAWPLSAECKLS